ncbi:MAG: hydantoinase/oxoprolinase family protein [gamma proteobacterium symbiont of Bathyaustriella thionipta]|nr:hydantoinase/oxoprolinase family protein [gamma proteobacterium symbiont of Bathyaustriella thionipta]MCU7948943.1 hydantoinase/oxoprolinase family protein [gamma proteobacterium symbiont of Bathyaustriella thionipta]MCU7953782.1 hydantoinase/oxoprolinase family protein [gamma proteobacterium symbiont of Bathyaustriella thionipta]MCU7955456.1 hydantoinase/oxoprolinase family protein [gamma proteobacterium symbiont of Bathyaustriella thionipta]MCU7966409.1 hydantoinase/oxoprolinase family pro
MHVLGVDTVGTFTDFVYYEMDNNKQGNLTIHKVLSTPHAPEQAILQGIKELGLEKRLDNLSIVHGSTVATNAVLEKKGVKTVYISNTGLADVLTIGRQARKALYNLTPEPEVAPVPASLCYEVSSRVAADGSNYQSLSSDELQQLNEFISLHQPQSVAINLLFSFLDDDDECRIEQSLRKAFPELFISRSSEVLPEYKEYERGIATWLNAWVGPLVQGYIQRLTEGVQPAQLAVMQSSGGTIAAEKAADYAVRMLLSGPAGGLAGAKYIAGVELANRGHSAHAQNNALLKKNLLTFDMGGTSTDVAVIEGELQLSSEGHIGDYPVAISMVDMHTIGAGGGSIARVDEGGVLQVGPESAGASPGPACYGHGGRQATVTDANLILGRLSGDAFLGGAMQLDEAAAGTAIETLAAQLSFSSSEQAIEETASGIIQVANEHMSRALRVMSIQRGIDPEKLVLVPFGGAGALHVCALAENLQMSQAMVPVHAGVLSALGMVVAPHSRDLSHTINALLELTEADLLNKQLALLADKGVAELGSEGIDKTQVKIHYSLDLRYAGQSYTLNVPWTNLQKTKQAFHDLHQKRYGHQHKQAIELVNVRVKVTASAVSLTMPKLPAANNDAVVISRRLLYGIAEPVPVYQRENLSYGHKITGPALIVERVSTTWLEPDWECEVDSIGNLLLSKVS